MSYEHQDASLMTIGLAATVLAVLVAFSIGVSAWLYHAQYGGASAWPTAGRTTSFVNGPSEKIGILVDTADVARAAADRLDSYGWVDRPSGVARIPIDRAMDLVVKGVKPAPTPKPPGQVP